MSSPQVMQSEQNQQRARVRNNQRNSRAKRQAYVKELEHKWGECIQFGAQASVELQLAARKVALENRFLRDLLRERGLDDEALRSRIQQFWQNPLERPAPDVELMLSPSPCHARTSPLPQLSKSTSTRESCRTNTPDNPIQHPIQDMESPQISIRNENGSTFEVSEKSSADEVAAPSWGFDSWLGGLYDTNGFFNEDFGNALDSFIAADMISDDQSTSETNLLPKPP